MSRKFGILLPVFSLFGEYGIGTFGKAAYEFVDFLAAAGVSVWQVLPLCPVDSSGSPYNSSCSAAFNPYYIAPEILYEKGLLTFEECEKAKLNSARADYSILKGRMALLIKAYRRYKGDIPSEPHSVFLALKDKYGGAPWQEWGEYSDFDSDEVKQFIGKNDDCVRFWDFVHFEAMSEWDRLRAYANKKGIAIIGDLPFYVASDSFEVWSNRQFFDMSLVAGVPPDYFSQTGQLWGNPVYKFHSEGIYRWWSERIESELKRYDVLRLDHFRAFDEFYAIPYGSKDATDGKWFSGVDKRFFEDKRHLPIIAEDLGTIMPSVKALIDYTGYPGMRVMQFGLDGGEDNPHALKNITKNCVLYTGTHDNMPLRTFVERSRESVVGTVGECDDIEAVKRLIMLGSRSKANLFVVPLFDLLHKGEGYRINTPSTVSKSNWSIRFKRSDLYGLEAEIQSIIIKSDRS